MNGVTFAIVFNTQSRLSELQEIYCIQVSVLFTSGGCQEHWKDLQKTGDGEDCPLVIFQLC